MAEDRSTERWLKVLDTYRSDTRGRRHPLTFHRSALMVIDMQRYFLDESSHAFLHGSSKVTANVRSLLELYRGKRLPIIFTRHALRDDEDPGIMQTWWGDSLRDSDPMSEIIHDIRPGPDEMVIRKTRYSAFIGTNLERKLRSMGVERLLIAGVMTHLCCESTARDAFMRDFEVFFVIDATSSGDDDLHLSSLRCLTHGFDPVTTEEVIGCARTWK